MLSTNKLLAVVLAAGLFAFAAPSRTAAQSAPAAQAPAPTPDATKVAAASPEAVKLLKLMDADQNGKISHAEFMAFMEAEFQRLDVDHDGQLDLKELEKSQLAVAHHGGTRR
ncbi:MAG: EF-hand domain-containing protein [Terracidiphilus sp.]|jgi:hypothetical protein